MAGLIYWPCFATYEVVFDLGTGHDACMLAGLWGSPAPHVSICWRLMLCGAGRAWLGRGCYVR